MPSHELETALRTFVEEAALALQADLDAGAEVPFELAARSARGRGAQLYCYRPLTDAFLRERWRTLEELDSCRRAARLLEGYEGLERYLLAREGLSHSRGAGSAGGRWGGRKGARRDHDRDALASGEHSRFGVPPERGQRSRARTAAALRFLVGDVFAEQSDFALREERLSRALAHLDCLAHAGATEVVVLATLHGLAIASAEVPLARGLTLARPEELLDVPDAVVGTQSSFAAGYSAGAWDAGQGYSAGAWDADHLLVTYTDADAAADPLAAVARGREAFGRLLRALRLFGDARLTLGRLAWARVGAGQWGAVALPWGGRPYGRLLVNAAQEDELRAFCSLVSRRAPREGELAWALARYEAGCERTTELQALSDYLLALRALLEPDGPSARALLAGRLAALCATPAERPELARRVARALALERAAIAGTAVPDARTTALVRELAGHLGALLRDVICGHLRPDLASLADELLARPDAAAGMGVSRLDAAAGMGVPRLDAVAGMGVSWPDAAAGMGVPSGRRSGEEDLGDAGETDEILNVPV